MSAHIEPLMKQTLCMQIDFFAEQIKHCGLSPLGEMHFYDCMGLYCVCWNHLFCYTNHLRILPSIFDLLPVKKLLWRCTWFLQTVRCVNVPFGGRLPCSPSISRGCLGIVSSGQDSCRNTRACIHGRIPRLTCRPLFQVLHFADADNLQAQGCPAAANSKLGGTISLHFNQQRDISGSISLITLGPTVARVL